MKNFRKSAICALAVMLALALIPVTASAAGNSAYEQGLNISPWVGVTDDHKLFTSYIPGFNIGFMTNWSGGSTLHDGDVTDYMIYVNGKANAVTINGVQAVEVYPDIYSGMYSISCGQEEFTQYPAVYKMSFKLKGKQYTADMLPCVVVYSDKSFEMLREGAGTPNQFTPNAFININQYAKYLGTSISAGQTIKKEEYIASANKKFLAIMQGDGNFVVYNTDRALWASNTHGTDGQQVTLAADGTFILYTSKNKAIWNAGVKGAKKLVMENDGRLAAYDGSGKIIWTATGTNGAGSGTFNTDVKPAAVKLNKTTLTLAVKKTVTLKATVSPSNAANKTVTWTSSNTKVATVTDKGVVKGVNKGKATITAKASNGKKATCAVTVK